VTARPTIKALIVDDEPMARQRIRDLLEGRGDVDVVGEASGRGALTAVQQHSPDLLFLDVQMPDIDGFRLLESLDSNELPAVIFVTAYDQYALKAFEVHAVDYLLKPFDRERFDVALERAKAWILLGRNGNQSERILELLQDLKTNPRFTERMVVKKCGRLYLLKTDEIDWIEAEGNYARLHVGKESHLIRETLSCLETKLDPRKLIRIHRSTMVNVDRIQELEPWFHGEFRIVLADGTKLTLTRGYRDKLDATLGISL